MKFFYLILYFLITASLLGQSSSILKKDTECNKSISLDSLFKIRYGYNSVGNNANSNFSIEHIQEGSSFKFSRFSSDYRICNNDWSNTDTLHYFENTNLKTGLFLIRDTFYVSDLGDDGHRSGEWDLYIDSVKLFLKEDKINNKCYYEIFINKEESGYAGETSQKMFLTIINKENLSTIDLNMLLENEEIINSRKNINNSFLISFWKDSYQNRGVWNTLISTIHEIENNVIWPSLTLSSRGGGSCNECYGSLENNEYKLSIKNDTILMNILTKSIQYKDYEEENYDIQKDSIDLLIYQNKDGSPLDYKTKLLNSTK